MAANLAKGSEFLTNQQLKSAVIQWQKDNAVNLYIRSSRSVDIAKKLAPKRVSSSKLKYFSIDYACQHGGRKYQHRGTTGTRPNQM